MIWLDVAGKAVALDMIVFGAVGIYVLYLRLTGRPLPRWLPFLRWFVKADRQRLDRLVAVLAPR